jgi:hypothetical protein
VPKDREQHNCKLDETMTFRLPAHLKDQYRKLTIEQKHEAEHRLRVVIARAVYDSRFDPDHFLGEEG